GDEGVHAQGDLYEDGADRVDGNVFHGIADGVLAGAEQIEERLAKDQHDGGQDDRYDDERGKAVAQDLLSAFVVFAAHADAGAGRAAHAQQIGERGNDHDEGKAHADAGQRGRADLGDVADVHAVDHVVQGIDDL